MAYVCQHDSPYEHYIRHSDSLAEKYIMDHYNLVALHHKERGKSILKEHIYTLNISDEHQIVLLYLIFFPSHHQLHPFPSAYAMLQVKR